MLVLTTTVSFWNRFLRLKHKSLGLVLVYVIECGCFAINLQQNNLSLSICFTTSNFAEISLKIIWNTNVEEFLDQKVEKKKSKKWLELEIWISWRAWPLSQHSWPSVMWRGRGAMLQIAAIPPTSRRWVIIIVYQYCINSTYFTCDLPVLNLT